MFLGESALELLKQCNNVYGKIIVFWVFWVHPFGLLKIRLHHWIAVVEIYLEHELEHWNMFLGESALELL